MKDMLRSFILCVVAVLFSSCISSKCKNGCVPIVKEDNITFHRGAAHAIFVIDNVDRSSSRKYVHRLKSELKEALRPMIGSNIIDYDTSKIAVGQIANNNSHLFIKAIRGKKSSLKLSGAEYVIIASINRAEKIRNYSGGCDSNRGDFEFEIVLIDLDDTSTEQQQSVIHGSSSQGNCGSSSSAKAESSSSSSKHAPGKYDKHIELAISLIKGLLFSDREPRAYSESSSDSSSKSDSRSNSKQDVLEEAYNRALLNLQGQLLSIKRFKLTKDLEEQGNLSDKDYDMLKRAQKLVKNNQPHMGCQDIMSVNIDLYSKDYDLMYDYILCSVYRQKFVYKSKEIIKKLVHYSGGDHAEASKLMDYMEW